MASRTKNIVVDIGSDYNANVFAYANGSATSALDLTGYSSTANGQIKKSYYSANVSATFNVWIQHANTGTVNLVLNRANTVTLTPGNYVYDVILESSGGSKIRIVEGILTATPGVSR